jgi:hypothetical protein
MEHKEQVPVVPATCPKRSHWSKEAGSTLQKGVNFAAIMWLTSLKYGEITKKVDS